MITMQTNYKGKNKDSKKIWATISEVLNRTKNQEQITEIEYDNKVIKDEKISLVNITKRQHMKESKKLKKRMNLQTTYKKTKSKKTRSN